MNESERHKLIVEILRIKPTNHGPIYTFQIAVPDAESIEISSERWEYLSRSLTDRGTNLIPLIVRRTQAYGEEKEYEVVYGADWCLVAQKLDIEKLWVWVFDMTDDQAAAAKNEMEQLARSTDALIINPPPSSSETSEIKNLFQELDKKLVALNTNIERSLDLNINTPSISDETSDIKNLIQALDEKLVVVNTNIEQYTNKISNTIANYENNFSTSIEQLKASIAALPEQIESIINPQIDSKNLLTELEQLIDRKLEPIINRQKEPEPTVVPDPEIINYDEMKLEKLRQTASKCNIPGRSKMNRPELIKALKKYDAKKANAN